jgi:hypothetical protein
MAAALMADTADFIARVRAWTYRRQLLESKAGDPLAALEQVVGVYSSVPTAPLALLARCETLDEARFLALEQERRAIRIPAMRSSIFLVPTEYATRIFAATRVPIESRQRNLAYAGIDLAAYEALKPRLLELTRESADPAALEAEVGSGTRLNVVLATMSREGLVLRLGSSLRTDKWLYVSTEAWLGSPLDERDRLASLGWLADVYLRAFGPARIKDFAWWAGVTQREAGAALNAVNVIDVGQGHLLPADLVLAFESVEPIDPDALAVLPKWDSYTMAYERTGRRRLVDDEHLTSAYTSAGSARAGATLGDGLPLLLQGGRAVGAWSHRLQGNRMQVTLSPFKGEHLIERSFTDAFEAIRRLLGTTGTILSLNE